MSSYGVLEYASRLAAFYGCQSTEQFCSDFGIDLRKLTRAEEGSLQALSELTGADLNALRQWSITVNGRKKTINGRLVYSSSTSRSRWRFCPCCVQEDVPARPALPPDIATYARPEWQLDFIRTCPIHHVRLLEYTMPKSRFELGNFVMRMLSELPEAGRQIAAPSNLEAYSFARLMGTPASVPALDDFELCHVVALSRAFGACILGYHTPARAMDDETLYRCECRGFDALAGGADTIKTAIEAMRDHHWKNNARQGCLARFGPALRDLPESAGKATLKAMVADRAFRTLPVKRGFKLLGVTCDRERVARGTTARILLNVPLSLWDAELAHAAWKVSDDPNPYYTLVDLDAAAAHFEALRPFHSFDWVAGRLGMGRAEVHRIIRLGILRVTPLPRTPHGLIFYREAEIEAAIAASPILTRRSASTERPDKKRLTCIGDLSSSFGVMLTEVIGLIESGAVEFWYDHDHSAKNTAGAIWVDQQEVLFAARGWLAPLSVTDAASILQVGPATVRDLLTAGLLDGFDTGRRNHGTTHLLERDAIERFKSKYATFTRMKELGLIGGQVHDHSGPAPSCDQKCDLVRSVGLRHSPIA